MFQSTPPRGGRPIASTAAQWHDLFQSTPPRGGRHHGHERACRICCVSIHAPARGATRSDAGWQAGVDEFQSTPPRGGRQPIRIQLGIAHMFQSTPPRGGRRCKLLTARSWSTTVSIHAPARGATLRTSPPISEQIGFNPRPRAGGDRRHGADAAADSMFQSTPPRGGRQHRTVCVQFATAVSIHAPARGATYRGPTRTSFHVCFNPRPRAGGDTGTSVPDHRRS